MNKKDTPLDKLEYAVRALQPREYQDRPDYRIIPQTGSVRPDLTAGGRASLEALYGRVPARSADFTVTGLSRYYPVWGIGFRWLTSSPDGQDEHVEFGNLSLVRLRVMDKRVHVLLTASEECLGKWRSPPCAVESLVIGFRSLTALSLRFDCMDS